MQSLCLLCGEQTANTYQGAPICLDCLKNVESAEIDMAVIAWQIEPGYAPPALLWDDAIREYLVRVAEARGRERLKSQGSDMNDADFLMGALTVMYALGLKPNQWPAGWIFGLMSGRSPLRTKGA